MSIHRTSADVRETKYNHSNMSSTRIQKFGRGSSILRSAYPLNDDQIREAAPSIFAEGAHSSRSDRFSYIPTIEVLTALRKEGFRPYEVRQGGSGDAEKRSFTKHLVRFRHDSHDPKMQVGGAFREIVMINAHDGTSSYQLMAGLFRMVCSNGMVVCDGEMDEVRVRHTGNAIPEVIDGCVQILGKLPEVSESVREMDSLKLEAGERAAFAKAALQLRYEDDAPVSPAALLTVRRNEDAAPTLWNTLNVIQENVIRGGLGYVQRDDNGRRKAMRKTREVKGIEQNTSLNRALWTLAEEMKKLKAA